MLRRVLAPTAALLITFVLNAACGGDSVGSPGRGAVQVFVAESQDPNFQQVELDIGRIEAKRGAFWEPILLENRTVQLMAQPNNSVALVTSNLPTGLYTAMRLVVTGARITDEDGPHAASVDTTPSTIPLAFDIHVAEVTPVTIRFNLSQSITQNLDGTYHFDPAYSVVP